MKKRSLLIPGAVIVTIAVVSLIVFEGRQTAEGTSPEYNLNGTVSVPAFNLPPSKYMSTEAKGLLMIPSSDPPADGKNRFPASQVDAPRA